MRAIGVKRPGVSRFRWWEKIAHCHRFITEVYWPGCNIQLSGYPIHTDPELWSSTGYNIVQPVRYNVPCVLREGYSCECMEFSPVFTLFLFLQGQGYGYLSTFYKDKTTTTSSAISASRDIICISTEVSINSLCNIDHNKNSLLFLNNRPRLVCLCSGFLFGLAWPRCLFSSLRQLFWNSATPRWNVVTMETVRTFVLCQFQK